MIVGFKSHAILKELTKAEILALGGKSIWHGQFLLQLKCVSEFCGTFTVQRGFITDGASIPSLLWNLLSDTDPDIFYPSLAHDWLYSIKGRLPNGNVTRLQADELLREQMLAIGTPRWKADSCFRAVRMWGPSSPWDKPTPAYKLSQTRIYQRKPAITQPR